MTILASWDQCSSQLLIVIFRIDNGDFKLIDSISIMKDIWTQNEIDNEIHKAEQNYNIEKWVSSGVRKIIEGSFQKEKLQLPKAKNHDFYILKSN